MENWPSRIAISVSALAILGGCGQQAETAPETVLNDWRQTETNLISATIAPPEAEQVSYYPHILDEKIGDRMDLPTETKRVSGYSGIIQALAADQIDMGTFGPSALASLHDLIGDEVQPLVAFRSHEGQMGYYSAILVRADSPYYSIEDLEGASLGYVDLNSTSGYIYPRWAMRNQGIEPDTFFGETGMTGGHFGSVIAISTSQYDAVVTLASTGDIEAGIRGGVADRMAQRGLLDMKDYRYIWTAGPMPQSAYVVRATKSQAYIDYLRGVLLALPYEEPDLVETNAQTRGSSFVATDLADFQSIIDMRQEEINRPLDATEN